MRFIFRQSIMFFALGMAAAGLSPATAQDKPTAHMLSAQDYVGSWGGQKDWLGLDAYDGYDRWQFRSDGTFSDLHNETGRWSVERDGYITFVYDAGGHSRYHGTIINGVLLGTMTNGESNGVFALRRE